VKLDKETEKTGTSMSDKAAKITKNEVEYVARLARLDLTDRETERMTDNINDILVYMEKLEELDVEGVEPMAHVLDLKNVLREDRPRSGIDRGDILDNAPDQYEGYFRVPPVIE